MEAIAYDERARSIRDYLKSGRIFICGEMEDPLMNEEIALLGEDQLLYSFDYPHGEAREDAAQNLLDRKDVSETQKQKILYNNPIDLQRAVIMLNSFAAPSNSASVVPD